MSLSNAMIDFLPRDKNIQRHNVDHTYDQRDDLFSIINL